MSLDAFQVGFSCELFLEIDVKKAKHTERHRWAL